jgi:hypothetical protein
VVVLGLLLLFVFCYTNVCFGSLLFLVYLVYYIVDIRIVFNASEIQTTYLTYISNERCSCTILP